MEKTFKYEFETERYYNERADEYDCVCEDFYYTVDGEELLEAVVDLVYDQYFRCKSEISHNVGFYPTVIDGLCNFIQDNDNLYQLVKDYESELKSYFEDDAYEEFRNRG